MENVLICLVLMLLLIIVGIASRLTKFVPIPIMQIILGGIVGLFFPAFQVGFNPDVFMLLFIPPLLFSDSWRFPKREFFLNTRHIIMLSIGLVFFSVAGIGYLVHWLIPAIPLAASFALAAALSPTDAVALKSMTIKSGMPERIRHILQGESLLNDASGLVSFKFAVAAMLTGIFSIQEATISLIVVCIGGLLVGIIFTYIFVAVLGLLTRRQDDETTTENLILILLPYAVYLIAEHFGFSGILAAVSAGFTMDKAGFLDKTMVNMRIEGRFVWGMLEVTLNGIIFLLLGLFLPNTFTLIAQTGFSIPHYLLIVFGITGTLVALRFVWIYLIFPFEILIARRKNKNWSFPNLKIVSAISFGGIRGAIALAAILSLPTLMPDGSPFPMRELLTIIVVGVVLCSLLLSTIALPLILPTLKKLINQTPMEAENEARVAAAQAGIHAIESKMQMLILDLEEKDARLCTQAGNILMASLKQLIASNIGDETEKKISMRSQAFEDALRIAALDGARQELHRLRKKGKISHTAMLAIMHRLDLRQIALLANSTHSELTLKQ